MIIDPTPLSVLFDKGVIIGGFISGIARWGKKNVKTFCEKKRYGALALTLAFQGMIGGILALLIFHVVSDSGANYIISFASGVACALAPDKVLAAIGRKIDSL